MNGKWALKHKNQSTAQEPSPGDPEEERPGGIATAGFSAVSLRSRPAHRCAELCFLSLLTQNSAFFGVLGASHTRVLIQVSSSASSQAHRPLAALGVSELDVARFAGLSLLIWLSRGCVCFPGDSSWPPSRSCQAQLQHSSPLS